MNVLVTVAQFFVLLNDSKVTEIDFILFIGAASGSCDIGDLDCSGDNDYLGLEAIRSLHRQLDDDDNGDIDLSESDDVCSIKI